MSILLDLRQAVIHKVHNQDQEELRSMIEGSVDGPEAALPGLGVMFEMMWKDMDASEQNQLVSSLHEHLKHVTPGNLTQG
ncbi:MULTISPECIES: small acid-soluble spore protein SspI [Paenibacillus]|uniref:Small, acid-soluble spore protein I n=3 Tax=Paenibacillus TaxID=44249 RepID=G4HLC2_9BACL|nr:MULTISPECIES: small acid-soluble spore protein SspI [Paenibacillus]ANY74417.1 small acid-soluble spore protein SspI [Paenibacillus ihbetae]EHB56848.1 small, acid-soluble spore protein I [Paenibacillus lactis 154]MBP1892633.1 small acid-soluble spore protein I (minor) [Paenibacillus lactis]MCM3493377.1 small acid-soluble spore protein SspI [Paenibacillus lactis]OOC63402.1 small acid-soluble spore protein SspI [Paenibacillus ihbetae]